MKGEFHVIPNLPCPLIMGTDFMKTYDIVPKWGKKGETDLVVIQGRHRIAVTVTKDPSAKSRKVGEATSLLAAAIPIKIKILNPPRRRQTNVYAEESRAIEPGHGMNVPITRKPLASGSYIFRPIHKRDLAIESYLAGVNAVVSDTWNSAPMANLGEAPVKIYKGQLLGRLSPYRDSGPVPKTSADFHHADVFFGKGINETESESNPSEVLFGKTVPEADAKEPINPFSIGSVDPNDVMEPDVSDHWGEDFRRKVQKILFDHSELFRPGLGKFNDGIKMPIPFKDETNVEGLKQAPYSMSAKDRKAMDEILDPLAKENRVQKVPLGTISPASSPAFVVWKDGKPRVVIDLRKINTRLYPDAYPLPKQDVILSSLGGSEIFSSIDLTKGFFQQEIEPEDRWKTTFVTPHRGLEWLTVSSMGLGNTPGFFQSRMEKVFKTYLWKFVLVYMDDIIVYSKDTDQHLTHLEEVLSLLQKSGVTLALKKCHFAYPSIKALGHHVSRLGLSTLEEKTKAIRELQFPRNLRELDHGLGFFGYYRRFVEWYAWIEKPLHRLKTRGFKGAPTKGSARLRWAIRTRLGDPIDEEPEPNPDPKKKESVASDIKNPAARNTFLVLIPTKECVRAWERLKEELIKAPTLAFPDFSLPFILYTDGSKEKGYGIALHQIGKDGIERPILFLSRSLNDAETRYWATELEAGALVWALTKLPQYFDEGPFTVVTDHSALKTALQTKTTGRRSARLNEWSMYLSTFLPRMTIIHREGRAHQNADGLSRLPTTAEAESYHTCLPTTVISDEEDFLKKVAEDIAKDWYFAKIIKKLKDQVQETMDRDEGPNVEYQAYRFDPETGLLYLKNKRNPDRLCIPESCHKRVLHYAHDEHAHGGVHRTHNLLMRSVFIPKMKMLINDYVTSCPACQLSKPSKQLPYGELKPIPFPSEPLAELSLDFIVGLPMTTNGSNAILTITDRFSKYVKTVPGKETLSAEEWGSLYWKHVFKDWGIPARLISDRDPKFNSDFWRAVFSQCGTKLGMTTAYHPSADGQAERSNQTVETALRCLLIGKYEQNWEDILPQVEYSINNFENRSTGTSPFEMLYGVKPKDPLLRIIRKDQDLSPQGVNFLEERRQIRLDATDAIKMAQAKMSILWDSKHRPPNLIGKVYIKVAKQGQLGYHIPGSSSLTAKKLGPFKIRRKIGNLAYELELPNNMKIHPVVSVIHLEQAKEDGFDREDPATQVPGPIIVDGKPQYVVEKLLRREIRNEKPGYRVKWKGYDEVTWQPEDELMEDVPDIVRKFNERKQRSTRIRPPDPPSE